MSQVAFDTLKFTETLKQAGVPEQHAKAEAVAIQGALGEALNTQVATKEDIQKLKDDMQAFKDEVKADTQGLKGEIQHIKIEMQDIKGSQHSLKLMLNFIFAFSLAMLPILLGILWKLFIPAG